MVIATGTPEMYAASALPPTAIRYSPSGVLLRTIQMMKAITPTMTTALGTPKIAELKIARNSGGSPKIGLPPV